MEEDFYDDDILYDDDWLERDDEALKMMREQEEREYMDEHIEFLEEIRETLRLIKIKNIDVHWIKSCNIPEDYNEERNSWEESLSEQEFYFVKRHLEEV